MPDLPSCQDCGAQPGQPHADGCDTARCLQTGMQRLSCTMRHNCGDDIWAGQWPGEADAIRLGWYSRFTDHGWQRCGPGDPGAGPDLNRLRPMSARWDKKTRRWEALNA